MMPILTMDELRRASPEQREAARAEVTVLEDLERYLYWLNSEQGAQVPITIELGRRKRSGIAGIHPSSACKAGACQLAIYFDASGEVPDGRTVDPELQRTFDMGTAWHAIFQAHFKAMYGDRYDAEIPCHGTEFRFRSYTDGVFKFTPVRFVLELKTIKEGGNYGFEKVQLRPMVDHVRQAHIYMFVTGAPFALIFYLCKNNSRVKEHAVAFDPVIWQDLEQTFRPVVAALDGGPRPEPKLGHHCRDCPFIAGCEAGRGFINGERRSTLLARRTGRGVFQSQ